jgi:lipoyl(octanoyl) transferase
MLIATASEFGITGAERAPWHAGVWVGDGYLAALGVRISRWVTHHGFALNVSDEVFSGFSTIVACGVRGKSITTLSACAHRPISVEAAAAAAERNFVSAFEYSVM